ncbi:DUF4328 domain-containing protein [Lentzea alba]|uniref:DUF4328 domain-containing protein n=1 Tax=Lentzea alba TaxID=2714351 RepID=UPI0039BF532E
MSALRPVRGVGLAATILIGVVALAKILLAALVWTVHDADVLTPLGAAVWDSLNLIWMVAFLGAGGAFMVWLDRARQISVAMMGADQHRFTKAWVYAGWFVPFANFYIPYAVVQDVWRGSDRSQAALGLPQREISGVILVWWLCFLLSNVSVTLPQKDAVELAVFATISAALSVVAGVLAARIIRQINDMQIDDRQVVA